MSIVKFLAAAALLFGPAPALAATTIIDVTGTPSASSPGFNNGGGAMVEFTITSDLTNVSFFADTTCISCDGLAFLLTDFGPSADLSDVVLLDSFDTSSSPILSTPTLKAGTYFLLLSSLSGGFVWDSTQSPTFDLAQGASVGSSLTTSLFDSNVPFQSSFSLLANENLLFQVTADTAAPVPEPSTWLLFVVGFGAMGFAIRREKQLAPPRAV
jgi:hypothetical protein